MARASAFLFATSLTIAGCGGKTDTGADVGAPDDTGGSHALYGDASFDFGSDGKDGGPDDTGGGGALYGDPAFDTGPDDPGTDSALYGDAPRADAGADADAKDTGAGGGALYGAPPP